MANNLIMKKKKFGKTWFIDLDGTIFEHNTYLRGENIVLENAEAFLKEIPKEDCLIFVTAREERYKQMTLKSLELLEIKFDGILFNITSGTRVLLNDKKETKKLTALALNKRRNSNKFPFFLLENYRYNTIFDFFKNIIFRLKYY